MANDNNKINDLVSYPDDDPTAEFEIPVLYADPSQYDAGESTSDGEFNDESVAVLKSNLISSTDHIEKLQLELEESRIQVLELRSEIETQNSKHTIRDAELGAVESRLRSTEKTLERREQDLEGLESDLQESALTADRLTNEAEQFRHAAKNDRSKIFDLEKQHKFQIKKLRKAEKKLTDSRSKRDQQSQEYIERTARVAELESKLADSLGDLTELSNDVDDREVARKQLEEELAEAKENLEAANLETEELSRRIDDDRESLAREQAEVARLSAEVDARSDEYSRLKAENQDIRRALQSDPDSELEKTQNILARQTGLIASYSQDVRQLETRIGKADDYADDLRRKLQVQSEVSDRALRAKQLLQTTLTGAQEKISELTQSSLKSEQRTSDIADKMQKLEADYEQESTRLQSDFESAQETIDDQTTMNEQLLSDLYDNRGFRQALEVQLGESEEKFDKKVRHLEQKANRLRNQVDDNERKLKNKDEAIAALMHELAGRSSKIETIGEMESAIEAIESCDTGTPNTDAVGDRERVTRLLVGNTEGQELRFPLFKNRLTIGRTANNDIQLNAQFISRRHAVIVTENSGTRIVDWGSKNGVFVNEKRIAEQILSNGDIVTIGTTDFATRNARKDKPRVPPSARCGRIRARQHELSI
jgi:chromosome segregation ATPase